MRIGEKVVVRVGDKGVVAALNNTKGTIIDEKISDSHLGMLCGISRWIVQFDEPVNVCGQMLATCEFKENELECLSMYEIVAYDKDADLEVPLQKTNDYEDALAHAMKFGKQCQRDLLLNPATGQPFDWVKLVNADNWDIVYWTSYNRFNKNN